MTASQDRYDFEVLPGLGNALIDYFYDPPLIFYCFKVSSMLYLLTDLTDFAPPGMVETLPFLLVLERKTQDLIMKCFNLEATKMVLRCIKQFMDVNKQRAK